MNSIIKILPSQNSQSWHCRIWTIVVLAIVVFSNQTFAAGTLDPTFGSGSGRVVLRYQPSSENMVRAAVLQGDGKIVLAGKTTYNLNGTLRTNLSIARLNADGSLDNTFGTGGWVLTSFGASSIETETAASVIILPDARILVGGASGAFMALARYNPDGSLDTTFDGDGKVTTSFDNRGVTAQYLLPQSDGKVIAVGSRFGNSGEPQQLIVLARFNTDGSLDSTFGNGGKYTLSYSNIINYLNGAVILPDGKILLSGSYVVTRPNCTPTKSDNCAETRHFLYRYDQQMNQDKKFGWRGKILNSRDYFTDLSITPDGHVLVGGKPRARRFSPNGWLETLFEPVPRPPNTFSIDGAYELKQKPNRTVVGCDGGGMNGDFAVVLFGSDGRFLAKDERDFADTNDSCALTLIQPDGKIIAVGRSSQQGTLMSFAVVRYVNILP